MKTKTRKRMSEPYKCECGSEAWKVWNCDWCFIKCVECGRMCSILSKHTFVKQWELSGPALLENEKRLSGK